MADKSLKLNCRQTENFKTDKLPIIIEILNVFAEHL